MEAYCQNTYQRFTALVRRLMHDRTGDGPGPMPEPLEPDYVPPPLPGGTDPHQHANDPLEEEIPLHPRIADYFILQFGLFMFAGMLSLTLLKSVDFLTSDQDPSDWIRLITTILVGLVVVGGAAAFFIHRQKQTRYMMHRHTLRIHLHYLKPNVIVIPYHGMFRIDFARAPFLRRRGIRILQIDRKPRSFLRFGTLNIIGPKHPERLRRILRERRDGKATNTPPQDPEAHQTTAFGAGPST